MAKAMGASATTKWDDVAYGMPPVINPVAEAEVARQAAAVVVGDRSLESHV